MNPYNKNLKYTARKLRRNGTPGERMIWNKLKENNIGLKFRRQYPIGKFIVDFYCIKARLAIEVDGGSHDEAKYNYDTARQKTLESLGVNFLRFTEYEVKVNIDNVLLTVENFINDKESTSP